MRVCLLELYPQRHANDRQRVRQPEQPPFEPRETSSAHCLQMHTYTTRASRLLKHQDRCVGSPRKKQTGLQHLPSLLLQLYCSGHSPIVVGKVNVGDAVSSRKGCCNSDFVGPTSSMAGARPPDRKEGRGRGKRSPSPQISCAIASSVLAEVELHCIHRMRRQQESVAHWEQERPMARKPGRRGRRLGDRCSPRLWVRYRTPSVGRRVTDGAR